MNNILQIDNEKQAGKLVKTGYRMLKILSLLIEKPCNYQVINEAFSKDFYLAKSVSDDMICMYINTLREIGCDISRPSKTNSFCYVLNSHPFEFKISEKESKTLEIILKNLVKSNDWKLLLDVCEFFAELKNFCSKDSDFNFLHVISSFMRLDFELVKKINYYCEKEKFIVVEYNSPNSGLKEIGLRVQKISLENERFYLWGHNPELKELQYLRVDRIKKITVISIKETDFKGDDFPMARYKLLNQSIKNFIPSEGQNVLKIENKEIFIEEKVKNRFAFVQKILSYGEDCEILEPSDIREEIISEIEELLKIYD